MDKPQFFVVCSYMFGKDCFLVHCLTEKRCRIVPDEDLQQNELGSFNKQVQYVIKRKYGVKVDKGTY